MPIITQEAMAAWLRTWKVLGAVSADKTVRLEEHDQDTLKDLITNIIRIPSKTWIE